MYFYCHLAGSERVRGVKCDIQEDEQVHSSINQLVREHGPPTVLVNAAGVSLDRLLLQTRQDDITTQIQTNLVGSIYTTKAVLKHMIKERAGCIINIGI